MTERSLVQLTLAWVRGFYREPEAIFWVFGFPIVLAFALGIAFKNRGPGELRVGVERGAGDSAAARVRRAVGGTAPEPRRPPALRRRVARSLQPRGVRGGHEERPRSRGRCRRAGGAPSSFLRPLGSREAASGTGAGRRRAHARHEIVRSGECRARWPYPRADRERQ